MLHRKRKCPKCNSKSNVVAVIYGCNLKENQIKRKVFICDKDGNSKNPFRWYCRSCNIKFTNSGIVMYL